MSSSRSTQRDISAIKEKLRAELPRLREKYAVDRLVVHGSRIRGDERPDSDLDILVDFEDTSAGQRVSLLDFIALKNELEDLLDLPVDLGETKALHGPAADNIRREAEYV